MTRKSPAKHRRLSASAIREAIAADLMQIKTEDVLTFDDIGRVIGKSSDQAARYCDGTASMSAETYAFAREAWNGRFTGRLDALLHSIPDTIPDRKKGSSISRASWAVSAMLEDDEITDDEIRRNRKILEEGRDGIDALLRRIAPKVVA